VERPCLSSHACLCALRSATWSITALSCALTELLVLLSHVSVVLLRSAPRFPSAFLSALSWSISSCVLPLFRARFRVRNVGGPLVFCRLTSYLFYSIARSQTFRNATLVLFLFFVIELTHGLHVCVIYWHLPATPVGLLLSFTYIPLNDRLYRHL